MRHQGVEHGGADGESYLQWNLEAGDCTHQLRSELQLPEIPGGVATAKVGFTSFCPACPQTSRSFRFRTAHE
eukprot:1910828-Rhodomonas_salina.1